VAVGAWASWIRRGVLHGDLEAQFVSAAIDPSDRYVHSLPGTDRYRLRVDELGLETLFSQVIGQTVA
jgi:hypothetical protein